MPKNTSAPSLTLDQTIKEIAGVSKGKEVKAKRRVIKVKKSEAGSRKVVTKSTDVKDPIRKKRSTEDGGETKERKKKSTKTDDQNLEPKPRSTVRKISRPKPIRGIPA